MRAWILKVVATILSTACAELLLPNGKTKQACRIVLSLVCILVFAEPVAEVKNFDFDLSSGITESVSSYTDGTSEYLCDLTEKQLVSLLQKKGISVENCEVLGKLNSGVFELEKVSFKVDKTVISGEDEHIIGIEEIKLIVAEALDVSEDKVIVYGE